MLSAPEVLTDAHDVSAFSCGKPALDLWLKKRALSNQRKGFSAVIVVHEAGRVAGYYGLAPNAVAPDQFARTIRTGQPPDPIPCILLGQLAVDLAYSGRGIGLGLLKHAYLRISAAAGLIGGRALVVRAIDEDAAQFWRRRGFIPSKDDPLLLARPIADIVASVKRAAEA